jgi:hypothetical protein
MSVTFRFVDIWVSYTNKEPDLQEQWMNEDIHNKFNSQTTVQ